MHRKSAFMMFLILFLVMAAGILYLGFRTAFVFQAKPYIFILLYTVILFFAFGMMMAGMKMKSLGPVMHVLYVLGNVFVGVLLYQLLSFIVVDIISLFAHFSPKMFGLIAFLATLSVSMCAIIIAATPRTKTTDIKVGNLQSPVRVVHLTDLHLGHYRGKRNLEKIVRITNEQSPDLVVITGDLFESEYNLNESTLSPLKDIKAPVYFVDGNHDIYTNDSKVKRLVADAGARVLENEMVEECGIQIIGLDYMDADNNSTEDVVPHESKTQTIRNTMPKFVIDSAKPSIVLHHSPIGGRFIAEAGAGLFLAGHTHGGQMFPLTIINNYLFEFNRGLYEKYGMQVYVSCGTGTFGPPMRFGTTSEIAVLNLLPAGNR